MPPMEVANLIHYGVVWLVNGTDDNGNPTYDVDNPVEIRCRFEWKRSESLDAKGDVIALDGKVAVPIAVEPLSLIWQGRLVDWPGTTSAATEEDIMRVVTVAEVASQDGKQTRRVLGLQFFMSGPLPQ